MRFTFTKPAGREIRPAIFLDRDGVINQRIQGGYVTERCQFKFLPGIKGTLASLSELGLPIIVVSNQAALGKGMLEASALAEMTKRFVSLLAAAGARIDAVYYCPHTPEAACPCRKPRPGLLKQAAREWWLDLTRSILVGDSVSDVEAARAVGCRAVFLASRINRESIAGRTSLLGAGVISVSRVSEIAGRVHEFFRSYARRTPMHCGS
jgi:D-glycero-D-manno-heptose 1,7-bisphosphate phosphatase